MFVIDLETELKNSKIKKPCAMNDEKKIAIDFEKKTRKFPVFCVTHYMSLFRVINRIVY